MSDSTNPLVVNIGLSVAIVSVTDDDAAARFTRLDSLTPVDAPALPGLYEYPTTLSRCWVRANMIVSVDGGAPVDGRAGGLAGSGDRVLFKVLREIADVVLVGAGTVRTENYSGAQLSVAARQARQARGQAEVPPIAVVTASGALDPTSRLFTNTETPPLVFTATASFVATGDRLLSTVLFTDIVGSSEKLAQIGDRAWRQTLDRHDRKVDEVMRVHRGRLVKSTGDGVLCIFYGPARAISAAQSLIQSLGALDLKIRAGLHTGEIEPRQSDVTGLAVHVAARLLTVAQPGEVLVTRTVADLVAGADIRFAERGRHVLKGIPGERQLLAAAKD